MLRLETRPVPSRGWAWASPVLAIALTALLGALLFIAMDKDPLRGLQVFFWDPVSTPYALSELAMKATPLLLIALGLGVCFRANIWNIGAEGQYIMGAIFIAGQVTEYTSLTPSSSAIDCTRRSASGDRNTRPAAKRSAGTMPARRMSWPWYTS